MAGVRKQGESVRRFIIENVEEHPNDIVTFTSEALGISRQAVNKHIQHLIAKEILVAEGATRDRQYKLRPIATKEYKYFLAGLREDVVWRNDIAPIFSDLPENVRQIWQYGFTEMLNNAIDHSSGSRVMVFISKTATLSEMQIFDDGEGIFKKIQKELNLDDERHSVLELAKGKLTTDPVHHTGEGIFFTSRMFDRFGIFSGKIVFWRDDNVLGGRHYWADDTPGSSEGTMVDMKLANNSSRRVKQVFDSFTSEDDYGFTKTIVPVRLAEYGDEMLVSRSQAKRLLARFDRFKTVMLDFEGVQMIGQAFADEIFRVFAQENPSIMLVEINTNPDVQQMINRARLHE
ncbi:MAG: STAS-like domain-containing protein [Desulfomonilaceae bacterium]